MNQPPPIDKAQDQIFDSTRSSRQKYVALVVGRPGLAALVERWRRPQGCGVHRRRPAAS